MYEWGFPGCESRIKGVGGHELQNGITLAGQGFPLYRSSSRWGDKGSETQKNTKCLWKVVTF